MEISDNLGLALAIYGGAIALLFSLSMVVWAFRDIRARSKDVFAHIFVLLIVIILNVFGLLIYLLLRPRETLSESYERSLEEEALLQEIENKSHCPGCGHRVQEDWQLCPHCHTRLLNICYNCHNLLKLQWDMCPYCATPQPEYRPDDRVVNESSQVSRMAPGARAAR